MTPCLSPEEFIDSLDDVLADERRAHVAACAACRQTAAAVRESVSLDGGADVPEPPAHFWPGLNARIAAAVEQSASSGWRAWLRWEVLVPMVGLTALVMALAGAVNRHVPMADGPTLAEAPATTPAALAPPEAGADSDAAFALMLNLVAGLPEGGFETFGLRALPEMGEAAAALSADERRALVTLLTAAVERPAS